MIAMANREVEKTSGEGEQEAWTLACVSALTAPSHVFTNKVTSYSNPFLSPPSVASSSDPRELRCTCSLSYNFYLRRLIHNIRCV